MSGHPSAAGEVETVLVVDDEPRILKSLEGLLEEEFSVVGVVEPERALEVLRDIDVSVILSDQRMPRLTGDVFLRRAREFSSASRILITGYADLTAVMRAVNEGQIYGYVSKPWDPAELKALVRRAAAHSRLLGEVGRERELIHALLGHIPDAIGFKDLDLQFTRLNHAQARLLGLGDPAPAVGRSEMDFLEPELARRWLEEDRRVLHSQVPLADKTERLPVPEGGARWLSITRAPIRNQSGAVNGLVVISRDISDRVRAERRVATQYVVTAALAGSSTLKEAIPPMLEAVAQAAACEAADLWLMNPDTLVLRHEGSWPSAPPEGVADEADRRAGMAAGQHLSHRVWRTRKPVWLARAEGKLPGDFGFPILAHASVIGMLGLYGVPHPPERDLRDLLESLGHQVSDFLERQRAEEALRDSEARFRTVFENAGIGIIRADARGRIIEANPAFAQMLGYSQDELRHMALADLTHGDDLAADLELFQALVDGRRERYQAEKRYVRRDRSLLWSNFTATVVRDEARHPLFTIGMAEDISDRKRLEAQLLRSQKMEALGQLAGGVAHDFNNLLGVITGYAHLLMRDLGVLHPGLQRAEQIRKAADRAAALTSQLLAFSRRQVLQPRVLDLNAVVEDVEKMLHRLIGEDIELITRLGPGLGCVMADPAQIEQVILNLCVNARDAMPKGGTLVIETSNVDLTEAEARLAAGGRPGPQVLLSVSDTGTGMDPETLSRIFEPFFTTKPPGKGTGLGLATVYGIIQQSAGSIAVSSTPGRGTRFSVYLPRVEGNPSGAAEPRAPESLALRGSEVVLLVEDAEALREMMHEILDEAGYTVIEGSTPDEALSAAASYAGHIDLLVTDVVMPRMNGRDLLLQLRAGRPSLKALYISGYPHDVLGPPGALDAGTQFLQKPFTGDVLLHHVRRVLEVDG